MDVKLSRRSGRLGLAALAWVARLTTSKIVDFRLSGYLGSGTSLGTQADDEQNLGFQAIGRCLGLGAQADDEQNLGSQAIYLLVLRYPG